jgi:hypothetical protein
MNVGGTFSDSTGSVLMTGNSQKLFGSNTFHNLTKISTLTGGFLVLESGKTQTINGTLRWQGASGNVLTIISASSAYTNLTSGGSQIVDHVAVMNNVASGQQIVCYTSAEGCVDNGENSNWLFEPVVTSSSSSSSSSLSSQPTQGGRRGTTIDNQNNTDEEERYNVLFSYPPDPEPGCGLRIVQFKIGATNFLLDWDQMPKYSNGSLGLQQAVTSITPRGWYVDEMYFTGIDDHHSEVIIRTGSGDQIVHMIVDGDHDGNIAIQKPIRDETATQLYWPRGTEFEKYEWMAAYLCPIPGVEHDELPEVRFIPPFLLEQLINTTLPPELINSGTLSGGILQTMSGTTLETLLDRLGAQDLVPVSADYLHGSAPGTGTSALIAAQLIARLSAIGQLKTPYDNLPKILTATKKSLLVPDTIANSALQRTSDFVASALSHTGILGSSIEKIQTVRLALQQSIMDFLGFTRESIEVTGRYVVTLGHPVANETPSIETPLINYKTTLKSDGESLTMSTLHLRIVNSYGEPYKNVSITLFSSPQTSFTDNDGVVTFFDVPLGDHRLVANIDEKTIETYELQIRPPRGAVAVRGFDEKVAVPFTDIVIRPYVRPSAPDPFWFPPLAILLMMLLIAANVLMIRRHLAALKLRRKKTEEEKAAQEQHDNKVDESSPSDHVLIPPQ